MRYVLFLLTILAFGGLQAAEKLVVSAEAFDESGKKKLYTYERFSEKKGDKEFQRAVHKDTGGKELVIEKMESQNGKLIRYDLEQKQLRQTAWIEASNGEVTFNLKKYRKNNFPQTKKMPDNFVVGLQIPRFIQDKWESLKAGAAENIKLGVWHRQEMIEFSLKKEKVEGGQMVVKMNPTSMLIRAAVDPIYFHFDEKTKDLVEFNGRLNPKEERNGKFYDVVGKVRYKTH